MPRNATPAVPGQRFGYWTVLAGTVSGYWYCRCDCGTQKHVTIATMTRGLTKSCGCRGKDWCRTHGMIDTVEYEAWAQMIQRCHNPKSRSYPRYGGRGIHVCAEWRGSFETFYRDMGPRPPETSLGRIDNDGGYEPKNCRWETREQQNDNRHTTVRLAFRGEVRSPAEWAKMFGIKTRVIRDRIDDGWSVDAAISTPMGAVTRWTKRK